MTYNYDIIKDTSTLSTISDRAINKLLDKIIYCIADAVAEVMAEDSAEDKSIDLDLGLLGKLSIGIINDNIQYKFIPSKKLESSVKQAVLEERNLLEDVLEKSFIDKIENVYKDLI